LSTCACTVKRVLPPSAAKSRCAEPRILTDHFHRAPSFEKRVARTLQFPDTFPSWDTRCHPGRAYEFGSRQGRGVTSHTGFVNPFGPHHCRSCSASVQTLKTSSRGAFNRRVRGVSGTPGRSLGLFFLTDILFPLFLQLMQINVQTIEAPIPEMPVIRDPAGSRL
jgi:hypothetical protein